MTEFPRLRLRRLITEFRAGRLDAESFCSQFENTYNMELDKRTLTPDEAEAFAALFEQVIWYSPLPDDRRQIPNYRSEGDIARAVERAVQRLGEEPHSWRVRRPSWGDTVRIKSNAPTEMQPGRLAAVCGMRELENDDQAKQFKRPIGTTVLLIELSDGHSLEIPEDLTEVENK